MPYFLYNNICTSYNYTETSFFSVFRGGTLGFEGVPVDGSAKMDDALMDFIEPFDLAEAVNSEGVFHKERR